MFGIRRRKPKNADDTFSVRGLQVGTCFHQVCSSVADEFRRGLSKRGRLVAFSECEFVTKVAYDNAYVVSLWLGIEGNSSVAKTPKLLSGNAISKQCAD